MAFNETLGAVKWIYPNNHILLVKFIGKLEEVPSCFWCFLLMDTFNFIQILPIALLMHLIISQKYFLRYMILVNLIRKDVRVTGIEITDFILFTNYSGLRVNLSEVEFNCVLNVHISQSKNIWTVLALLEPGETSWFFGVMNDMRCFFQKFDAHREELIQFNDWFHLIIKRIFDNYL